ncbi:MAG: phosphoadenylyl-sulfate reductase [Planctomycetota bacterium]
MPSTSTPPTPTIDLDAVNARLADAEPAEAVRWAADAFGYTASGGGLVMSTSFGVQSAVMLHLVTQVAPEIPVIFIDTGFHFQETYTFADELTDRLSLNLKVYAPAESPSWFVARHGQLWESDNPDDLNRYDRLRKVEPMARALDELGATATLAGLRRQQTNHRANLRKVAQQDGRFKVAPILTWSTKDVHDYLKTHDLPYHPLHEQGYASVGDWHSTRPITAGEDERSGRFNGLKQECGLHLPTTPQEDESRFSSGL